MQTTHFIVRKLNKCIAAPTYSRHVHFLRDRPATELVFGAVQCSYHYIIVVVILCDLIKHDDAMVEKEEEEC